jgi:peroxiredoxin Q/BCP
MGFPFELIADPDEKLCDAFGVIKMKNMYGRQVRGIERSTFLIDADGKLAREWRSVKVAGHADEVLTAVKATLIVGSAADVHVAATFCHPVVI